MLSIEKLQKNDPIQWQDIGAACTWIYKRWCDDVLVVAGRCLHHLVELDIFSENNLDYFKQFHEILRSHSHDVESNLVQWFIVTVCVGMGVRASGGVEVWMWMWMWMWCVVMGISTEMGLICILFHWRRSIVVRNLHARGASTHRS